MTTYAQLKNAVLAVALIVSGQTFAVDNGDYAIDSVHTTVAFTVDHLGYTSMLGRFNDVSGEVTVKQGKADIEFTIKSASIDTNHEKRDVHLRSPDFFNVKQYPVITFDTENLQLQESGKLKGTLTMLGQSKTIEFDLTQGKAGQDPWGLYRVGYTATGIIKRSDFGMNFMQGGLGDDISFKIFIEAVKQ